LFQWEDGVPLTKPKFMSKVRAALSAANLPTHQFADHSFRRGAATTVAMAGIQDSTIQMEEFSIFALYIKLNPNKPASSDLF